MKPAPRPTRKARPSRPRTPAAPGPELLEPGETLQEAESEIGMQDWCDPETGDPAEGQAPPRLPDE